jgi:hypothetical protein
MVGISATLPQVALLVSAVVILLAAGGAHIDRWGVKVDLEKARWARLAVVGLAVLMGSFVWLALDPFSVAGGPTVPPTVKITEPATGADVAGQVLVRGVRTGRQSASQHLWLFVHDHNEVIATKLWIQPQELQPDGTGQWATLVNLGGELQDGHDLILVVTDQRTHVWLDRFTRAHPNQPLLDGLPAGVDELDHISVRRTSL